jgi:hypothetical protein
MRAQAVLRRQPKFQPREIGNDTLVRRGYTDEKNAAEIADAITRLLLSGAGAWNEIRGMGRYGICAVEA